MILPLGFPRQSWRRSLAPWRSSRRSSLSPRSTTSGPGGHGWFRMLAGRSQCNRSSNLLRWQMLFIPFWSHETLSALPHSMTYPRLSKFHPQDSKKGRLFFSFVQQIRGGEFVLLLNDPGAQWTEHTFLNSRRKERRIWGQERRSCLFS